MEPEREGSSESSDGGAGAQSLTSSPEPSSTIPPPTQGSPASAGRGMHGKNQSKSKRSTKAPRSPTGCQHYRRRCRIVAPCCNKEYWCRHCHNADADASKNPHELDRKTIVEVVCALCTLRQPISAACTACHATFGEYACLRCSFFDDDLSKQQFHCDACGICRVGGAENFFHCSTCGCCYHINLRDNHKCVEKSMHHNCPICFEFLFDSIRPTSVLRCGHTIHSECFADMQRNGMLACPVCLKSVSDCSHVWRSIDAEVAAAPMPEEYLGWQASICCNDCNVESVVAFHALGMKCPDCGSYNTRRIGLLRPEDVASGSHGTAQR